MLALPELSRNLSDELLWEGTARLASEERRLGATFLLWLKEVDRRQLHLKRGYESLFTYLVEELHYARSTAYEKINAMRLLRDLPELQQALETGAVQLGALSQVGTFLRREEKKNQVRASVEEKRELVNQVMGKDRREVELILAERNPEVARPPERERVVAPEVIQLSVCVTPQLHAKLRRIRELGAHRVGASYEELLEWMAEVALRKLEKERMKEVERGCAQADSKGSTADTAPSPTSRAMPESATRFGDEPAPRRTLPAALVRQVWRRDQGKCQYEDPKTGRKCSSRHALQVHHLRAFALGGQHTAENLSLRCAQHNAFHAVQDFGEAKMARYGRVPRPATYSSNES